MEYCNIAVRLGGLSNTDNGPPWAISGVSWHNVAVDPQCDKGLRNIMDILAHPGISWYRNVMDCLSDHCIWWDSMEQHGAPWNSVGIIMSRSGLEGNDYLYILNLLAYRGAAWDANC